MKTVLAVQVELHGQIEPMHLVVHFVPRKKMLGEYHSSFKGWPESWKTDVRAKKEAELVDVQIMHHERIGWLD